MRLVWALAVVVVVAGPASAQPSDTDTDAARALFKRGMAQYELGHYREALSSFEQAKAIKPLPAFDYNLARCHEQLAEWQQAIDAYERYLDGTPPPPDAPDVRAHVGELRRKLPPMAATPEVAPPPPPSPTPPPVGRARRPGLGRTIAGGVVGGVGVLLLGGGVAAGLDGDKQADALTAADRANRPFDPTVADKLQSDRALEIGLLVVGAAATATGVVLIVLGRRADGKARSYAWSRP